MKTKRLPTARFEVDECRILLLAMEVINRSPYMIAKQPPEFYTKAGDIITKLKRRITEDEGRERDKGGAGESNGDVQVEVAGLEDLRLDVRRDL